ncbi:uncharacterized protein LOC122507697 [Leptopilina heterotoma]|uniref:uncharacterized protein LOC122507697 n=1 Tax=Leptopilina heterotoma TaxID=63436 RepID=UPI001CA9C697|nr:uncharacterized protein LOC122507697 [Leptopilina heterotoma]
MSAQKLEYHRASNAVVFGGVISHIAGILLLISFASPYWMESYDEAFSTFKNMGLWEYCFEHFRFPNYQFDKIFDGCNNIFSLEYYVLREWLVPGWLMVVQAFVTLSLFLSLIAQGIIASVTIRYPLRFVLRYEWLLSSIACLCNITCSVLLFLSVAVFGSMCWRRDWLMYPKFNHLSWSYGIAVISTLFHGIAAFFLYLDARTGYKSRKESRNLVMQMQPNPQSHHGLHRSNYI